MSVSYVRNHSLTHGNFPERDLCQSYKALLATLSRDTEQDSQRVWGPTGSARLQRVSLSPALEPLGVFPVKSGHGNPRLKEALRLTSKVPVLAYCSGKGSSFHVTGPL